MSVFLQLIDPKVLKILDVFVKNKNEHFHLNKLSKSSGVPLATTFRIVKQLLSLDVIEQVSIHKFKIYKLAVNEKTAELERAMERYAKK